MKILGVVFSILLFLSASAFAQTDLLKSIQKHLAKDSITSTLTVNLTDQSGVISIEGTVETDQQAVRLVEIVMETAGVTDVELNKLYVQRATPALGDAIIAAKVRGTYVRMQLFGPNVKDTNDLPINVFANDGIVFLQGFVDNLTQLAALINTARRVSNVQRVISELVIRAVTVPT